MNIARTLTAAIAAIALTACTTTAPATTYSTPAADGITLANASGAGGDDQLSVSETPWWHATTTPPTAIATTASLAPPPTASALKNTPTATARPTGTAPVPPTRTYSLNGDVLFQPNSAALTPGAASQLNIILTNITNPATATLHIDGYTDHGPAGTEENPTTATQLSTHRATTIATWFTTHNIPNNHITTHGWGDTHPLNPSDTDSHRAANRRCNITVTGATQ